MEHRSIRKYKNTPIEESLLDKILEAGTRASTTGNMQLYSIIVTTDKETKEALLPCHFGQKMITEAPVVLTFCADVNRFSAWCDQRDAKPEYHNFMWFFNGAIDALLASQNVVNEAEKHDIGICYLGTTTYTADRICDILELPKGVVPVTTVVMGYPDEMPPLTDRLPLEAVVHKGKYVDYTPQKIDELWREREESDFTKELLVINELPNLAKVFTEKRYKAEDNILFSKKYLELLNRQGFI